MKAMFLIILLGLPWAAPLLAQRSCATSSYQLEQLEGDTALAGRMEAVEQFTRNYLENNREAGRPGESVLIRIPVVIHILYHYPGERDAITEVQVAKQIDILNQCFRRTNADTASTPAVFKSLAADCEIEFQLATSDPQRRNTTGIIRKYSPIVQWQANDEMKFSASMGDDAWDPSQYLNIWVCNLKQVAGYSSLPGGPPEKDGVVIGTSVFGPTRLTGMDMGKTAVHEVGHWLHLRHLWGDDYCGDDLVHDTPRQGWYNAGCPSGPTTSCNNGPFGDMFMNYMDFTNDACVNMFTLGQKARMRALFAPGGPRSGMLQSIGLLPPLIFESPLPDDSPRWLYAHAYPNPANMEFTIDLSYDPRWLGKTLTIMNMSGQAVKQVVVQSREQLIRVSGLKPGLYILYGKKEDGETIRHKFVKL